MFGYFSGGRFMSAFIGADREFYRAANRVPGSIKLLLVFMVIFIISKPEQAKTIIRNTFILIDALLAVDFAIGGLSGGLYGFLHIERMKFRNG